MRANLFVVVLLALAVPASAQSVEPKTSSALLPVSMVIAGNAVDLGSTIYAIDHGARETDPLLGSKLASIVPLKIVFTVWQAATVQHLVRTGHPKAATIIGAVTFSAFVPVAIHNVQIGRR